MNKKVYITPDTSTIRVVTESLMAAESMGFGEDKDGVQGDAKQHDFDVECWEEENGDTDKYMYGYLK